MKPRKWSPSFSIAPSGGPLAVWRVLLGLLAALNVVAFILILFPPGGSAQQLDLELASLRTRMSRQQADVQNLRGVVKKVETARAEQEAFIKTYFMASETTSSTILAEIDGMSRQAGLKFKEHSLSFDPIEGSESLSMMTITANYEGNYADLVEFVNLIDRSDRFLIIDSLQAAPQQVPGMLTARFRMNAFIREARIRPAQAPASAPEAAP